MGFYSLKRRYVAEPEIPDYTGMGISEYGMITSGKVNINKGLDRINQSIRQIITTPIGTRFFVPEFGSRIPELMFEPNDSIVSAKADTYIKEALAIWEPRIKVIEVLTDNTTDPRVLNINIKYQVLSTKALENYVYSINREVGVL